MLRSVFMRQPCLMKQETQFRYTWWRHVGINMTMQNGIWLYWQAKISSTKLEKVYKYIIHIVWWSLMLIFTANICATLMSLPISILYVISLQISIQCSCHSWYPYHVLMLPHVDAENGRLHDNSGHSVSVIHTVCLYHYQYLDKMSMHVHIAPGIFTCCIDINAINYFVYLYFGNACKPQLTATT